MGGKKSIARTSVLVENMAVTIVFISLASSLLPVSEVRIFCEDL